MQRSARQASGVDIAEVAPVSRLELPGGPVWAGHVHAVLLETVFEPVTVICPIANVMVSLGLQHVEVGTELHQRDHTAIPVCKLTGVRYPHITSCPAMGCAVVSTMGLGQVSGILRIFLALR